MIKCLELNKEFDTRLEMLKSLYENKDVIIAKKKSVIYESSKKAQGVPLRFYDEASKQVVTSKGFNDIRGLDKDFIYPVISNTGYADSHKDVHLPGSMNRTVKNQQGKIHYTVDHKIETGKIIAYPHHVEMMMKDISWKDLGKPYKGMTEALLFKTQIQKYSNKDAVIAIEEKLPMQHSIRMLYYDVVFGIKDRNEEWEDANKAWDDNIDKVVNREDVDEDGYLYFVKELGIVREGSMLPEGSNDATPLLIDESAESTSSKEIELAKALQDKKEYFINKK